MKRCPACNQTYTDDTQKFCLNDGTPLVTDSPSGRDEPPPTVLYQPPAVSEPLPPRSSYSTQQSGESTGGWSQQLPPPNPSWQQTSQQSAPPKRSKLPLVLGILAVVVIGGLAALGIGGYLIYRSASTTEVVTTNTNKTVLNTNTTRQTTANTNTNTNTNANTNANTPPANQQQSPQVGKEAAPTDEDEVLEQLKEIEDDWVNANITGDKDAINRILADDYASTAEDGTVEKKADYIKNLRPSPNIKSQDYDELDLSLKGNTATLSGITTVYFTDRKAERYRFTDTFTWRDGRWQAISSQASRIGSSPKS